MWGATPRKAARAPDGQISIHAPRVGRDGCYVSKDGDSNHFNPRAPCGARPRGGADVIATSRISIHAPRVGRDLVNLGFLVVQPIISIHAPRVGRDIFSGMTTVKKLDNFNPRAPCGARRLTTATANEISTFQSTRPVWGATLDGAAGKSGGANFNPRAPCGARLLPCPGRCCALHFNPRAPCGARQAALIDGVSTKAFQSTRPVWGATFGANPMQQMQADFNPRAPCGARRSQLCEQRHEP